MTKIVTLTTDWGNSDYYIGAVKASILSSVPDTVFVDISHNIEHFNWQQAGFVLGSIVEDFPEGSIHIIGVDSEPEGDMKVIVAKYMKQYFICTDNGTLGIIFKDEPELVIAIDVAALGNEDCVFMEKNVFAEIAKLILRGKNIRQLGTEIEDVTRYTDLAPQTTPRGLLGNIIYIDSYGNAISNINREIFENTVGDNKFEILLNTHSYKVTQIYNSYKEVEMAEIVCLFNSIGLLEIAIRGASAKNLLGLRQDSQIRIDIKA
ncbi:MAG: SAM-dependent chlorinase/fluorinase [Bacteroidales bacterium]|nr:SAM-dependent chlorinase/fluorinase [Bacteroidales bacterium]